MRIVSHASSVPTAAVAAETVSASRSVFASGRAVCAEKRMESVALPSVTLRTTR